MKNIVLDIETLATSPESAILQIAAIEFDPFAHNSIAELAQQPSINFLIEPAGQDRLIDENTIAWWATQPREVQDRIFADAGRVQLGSALSQLTKFVWNKKQIWCQGPVFDIPILEHAYQQCQQHVPWEYWRIRDSRTLFDLVSITLPTATHDAIEDCARQAWGIQQALRALQVSAFQR